MDAELNITDLFTEKYPETNVIFPNKTLIVISKKYNSNQQVILLAGLAFVGGIVAGLLIRCIYFGIVRYFMVNVDQLVTSERPTRGNANLSFVDDIYRSVDDQPPDYLAVVTESSTDSTSQLQQNSKFSEGSEDSKIYEKLPPNYKSVVSDFSYLERSSSV